MKKYNIRLMMPDVGHEELKAIEEVLQSGQLVEGAKAHEFESLIAKKSGAEYCTLCTSATVGLEMALKSLNLSSEDEVVIPAFTHPATLLAVLNVGLTPVFADVDKFTFNTSADLMKKSLSDKTKVLMPVSWGGYPLDMKPIMSLAKDKNLFVIEDAACALGTSVDGASTGQMADMTVFSFHPRKLIALGDGGAIVTNNEKFYKKLKKLKHFGSEVINNKMTFLEPGGNFRLSNVLAGMGIPQINKLDELIKKRVERAQYYNHLFAGVEGVNTPKVAQSMKPNYQSYCISFDRPGLRDFVLKNLKEMGIEVQFGTYSVDREPVAREVRKPDSLEGSHFLGDHLLTLPLHHQLTAKDQDNVFNEILSCMKQF